VSGPPPVLRGSLYRRRDHAEGRLATDCIGNLIGPQTFRTVDAPRYVPALGTIVACDIVLLGLMTTIHLLYQRENKRRDGAVTQEGLPVGHEFDDMTDR
jgi:ACS family allantoate permease-like MFS transporter